MDRAARFDSLDAFGLLAGSIAGASAIFAPGELTALLIFAAGVNLGIVMGHVFR